MSSRRNFLKNIVTFGAGAVACAKAFATEHSGMQHNMPMQHGARTAAGRPHMDTAGGHSLLVETPDVPQLPWRMEGGVKEFHLVAEPVKRRLIPARDMGSGVTTGGARGRRSRSIRVTVCGSYSRTTFLNRPPSIGTAWKFR